MESETAHIWKKKIYFTFGFFLFVGDEVKTNDLKCLGISVSIKCSSLGTVIYLSERIY